MPRSIGREWCGILLLATAFNFGVPAVTKEASPAPISTFQHHALDTTNGNPVSRERVCRCSRPLTWSCAQSGGAREDLYAACGVLPAFWRKFELIRHAA